MRGGAAAAYDNKERRREAGGSWGLGGPRAGYHGNGSPKPVGRHLTPRLKSAVPASRRERGEAQGPQGNVVQAPRSFRREWESLERKLTPGPPEGVVLAPDSSHHSCVG